MQELLKGGGAKGGVSTSRMSARVTERGCEYQMSAGVTERGCEYQRNECRSY